MELTEDEDGFGLVFRPHTKLPESDVDRFGDLFIEYIESLDCLIGGGIHENGIDVFVDIRSSPLPRSEIKARLERYFRISGYVGVYHVPYGIKV